MRLVDLSRDLPGREGQVRHGDDRSDKPLVAIHKKLKQGKGKRTEELALNRAIVVLTVAAWQAYVQDITREAIDLLKPAAPPLQTWNLLNAQASRAIQLFSTPNAEKSRDLLLYSGFDPHPAWTWKIGPESLTVAGVCERMDRWLKVRQRLPMATTRFLTRPCSRS